MKMKNWGAAEWLMLTLGVMLLIFLCYGLAAAIDGYGVASSEAAGWVQAIGSIAAIGVAIWVSHRQHEKEKERSSEDDKIELVNMLRSIRDEISVVTEEFAANSGKQLFEGAEGTAYMFKVPLGDRNFPIYEAYVEKIGKIPHEDLRRLIVIAYGRALGVVQGLKMNNALVEKFEDADYLARVMNDDVHKGLRQRTLAVLEEYGDTLRADYRKAQSCVEELLKALNRHIEQAEIVISPSCGRHASPRRMGDANSGGNTETG